MGMFGKLLGGVAAAVNPVGLLGTGLSLGGSVLDFFGQQQTNNQNADIASRTNATNLQLAQAQMEMQKQFAQNGITWRIQDAARNGIAPLAALGSSEPGYSPVMPVMNTPSYTSPLSSASAGFNEAGQNVTRALASMQSPQQRQADSLDLAWKARQNDLLDVQIANAKLELARNAHPGLPLSYREVLNRDGSTSIIPAEGVGQSLHGQWFGPTEWSLRNKLVPDMNPSSYQLGPRKSTSTWNWGGN